MEMQHFQFHINVYSLDHRGGVSLHWALTLFKQNLNTDYCKKGKHTYYTSQELLEVTPFCLQTCLAAHNQVL
jgi:hypothetical protein